MWRRKILSFVFIAGCVLSYLALTTQKSFLLPTSSAQSPAQTKKPTRRALLVGIDNYERDPEFQSVKCHEVGATKKPARKRSTTSKGGGFNRLEGPVDDVCMLRELLITSYGFEAQNVHVVEDQDATHDGILAAFKRYLIDEAAPGDVCLFFYSGHGSQVKNSLNGEADQLDRNSCAL